MTEQDDILEGIRQINVRLDADEASENETPLRKGESREDRAQRYLKASEKQAPGITKIWDNQKNGQAKEQAKPKSKKKKGKKVTMPDEILSHFTVMIEQNDNFPDEVLTEAINLYADFWNGEETSEYEGEAKEYWSAFFTQSQLTAKYSRQINAMVFIPLFATNYSWKKKDKVQVPGAEKGVKREQLVDKFRGQSWGIVSKNDEWHLAEMTTWDEDTSVAIGSLELGVPVSGQFSSRKVESQFLLSAESPVFESASADAFDYEAKFIECLHACNKVEQLNILKDYAIPQYPTEHFVICRIASKFGIQKTKSGSPWGSIKVVDASLTTNPTSQTFRFFDGVEEVYGIPDNSTVIVSITCANGKGEYAGSLNINSNFALKTEDVGFGTPKFAVLQVE